MPAYKAPVDDYMFVLHDLLRIQDMGQIPAFSDLSEDLTRPIFDGLAEFCEDVWQPLNQSGDEEGCRLENGVVRTPKGFPEAYKKFCDAGWNKLTSPEEFGGAGLPGVIGTAAGEVSVGSNAALSLYSGLTNAALSTLQVTGAPWMRDHVLPRMVEGIWTGTMCLTEPHCGTDLRLMKTKAVLQPDGTHKITGAKIFISGGDHDLSENIIHLVLAKLPNAEGKYVDDLSTVNFFLVSKKHIDPETGKLAHQNGVTAAAVEKKMGIKGNATCVLNFDEAVAYRLGGQEPSGSKKSSAAGMSGMFLMMNRARLGTGISALAVAEAAYQNSAIYARERIAGKAPSGSSVPHAIISYPDVRRMLIKQRSFTEGARAFGAWVSLMIDIERHSPDAAERQKSSDLVQLLTPVIKAYFSDRAFDGANAAVQIYGGHGYIRDNGVEQFVRDSRIYQIFEGANGVQAHDLVTRKLAIAGGRAFETFVAEIHRVAKECDRAQLSDASKRLCAAADDLVRAVEWIRAKPADLADDVAAASYDILNIFGLVSIGMMWARTASTAQVLLDEGRDNVEFLNRKLVLARYWLERELPMTRAFFERASLGAGGFTEAEAAAL